MRRAARTDANHASVVQALRSCGWQVFDMSRVGGGCPDVIAAKHGRVEFVEIKDGSKPPSKRALTPDELDWHASMAAAGVRVKVIESIEQAVSL